MLIIAIRTFILYGAVLLSLRIMGKSELSKMSPFQMVIAFMIAELAAMPIDSPDSSLINGIMAIITLTLIQVTISFISIKNETFKNFISGKPSILIEKGCINIKELRKLRITTTDLLEQLRLENCPSISSVQYAIMESNGQLTVIPKASDKPLTPSDMKLSVYESTLPMILISDGVFYHRNLYAAGLNEDIFTKKLSAAGINDMSRVFLAMVDGNKKFHIYLYSEEKRPFASEVII